MLKFSLRRWLLLGLVSASVALGSIGFSGIPGLVAADSTAAAPAAKGQLTNDSLGTLINSLGLKPKREESRYDFAFKSKQDEDWEMSLSVVLSNDAKTLWIYAWLDELPKNAADVPRNALLRLLADNDKLGNGQFFAYIPSNRRFVLQRVVPNENITSSNFKATLVEMSKTVSNTYGHWSVANWKNLGNSTTIAQDDDEGDEEETDKTPAKPQASPANKKAASPSASNTATGNSAKPGTVRK